jgi:competence ComEA-like helix-hairpin-helix protein
VNIQKIFLLILIVINSIIAFGQSDSTSLNTDDALDDILQEPFEETDNSDLYDQLEQLIKNPIDINSATISELQIVPGLDLSSAQIIINHRKKYGNFFSVYELNAVQGLDNDLVKKIIPFLTVKKPGLKTDETSTANNIFNNSHLDFRSRMINELQTRQGFTEKKYEGTKPQLYNRLIVRQSNNYQAGFLTEKDPGEKSFNEFTSYHIYAKDISFIHQLVVFDYLLEFGQGLTLWSPYAFSKGADAIYPIKRNARNIRPYTSASENNFFRGVAASFDINNFTLTGFYSKNNFDANIDSLTGEILSTPVDGLHRTESEISKRKTATEKMIGAKVDYNLSGLFKTGILYYKSEFSNPFVSSSVFDHGGEEFSYTAFNYDLIYGNLNLFGEFSYDNTSVASINTLLVSISKSLTFTASLRNYPRIFFSLHGFGFGERSGVTSNEFGIYTGIKWRLPFALLNFYYDQFKFPYATSSIPLPSEGDEFLVDILTKPFSKFELKLRYKIENKEQAEVVENRDQLVKRIKQLGRLELVYYVSNSLRLKGRIEISQYNIDALKETENGFLVFQDIRYLPIKNLNIYGRIIFFKTDSFNSAIYEYENNLTGILTNLAMYGEGTRWYFILKYEITNFLDVSFRYSETYKPKESYFSSGLNEIIGNIDNDIAIQIDLNL